MLLATTLVLLAAGSAMAVPQDFTQRSVANGGGFALVAGSGNSCPADTTQCSGYDCCPNSLTCHGGVAHTIAASCCPASSSCLTALVNKPFCADDSWLLFNSNDKSYSSPFFCCQSGQIGLTDGSCASNQTQVAASLLASLVTPGAALGASSTSAASVATNTASTPSGANSRASSTGASATQKSLSSSTSGPGSSSTSGAGNGSSGIDSIHLSTGAEIGIAVGAVIAIVIVALLIYLVARINQLKRRQRTREAPASVPLTERWNGENAQPYDGPPGPGYPEKQVYPGGGWVDQRELPAEGRGYAAQLE